MTTLTMPLSDRPDTPGDALLLRTVAAVLDLDPDALRGALDDGGDPNSRVVTVNGRSTMSQSLIDIAWAQRGMSSQNPVTAVITLLFERGADPNACNPGIWPAICFSRHEALFLPFLGAGASPNANGHNGEHPFFALYEKYSQEPLNLVWLNALIAHGMDVNGVAEGSPILVQAAFGWDLPVVQRLIEAGASPMIHGQHIVDWMAERVNHEDEDAPRHAAHVEAMRTWWVHHEQAVLQRSVLPVEPAVIERVNRPRL